MARFRERIPTRTCNKSYKNYRSFKKYLRIDFAEKCGYCDEHDFWSSGPKGFHIDHFAPEVHFPQLRTTYSNLVYSCFYCNNSKSDTWISNSPNRPVLRNKGFVDPCDPNYENKLGRRNNGEIYYKNRLGKFMYDELSLGLLRHSLIWKLEKLRTQIKEINRKLASKNLKTVRMNRLLVQKSNLESVYFKFTERLRMNIEE